MPSTYTPIATYTASTAITSYTFSSIPQTYTDLVLIGAPIGGRYDSVDYRVGNGSVDTGSNYSKTSVVGRTNNTAVSFRATNYSWIDTFVQSGLTTDQISPTIAHFINYSNTTTFKTVLIRDGAAANDVEMTAGLWRSTSAISAIQIAYSQNGGQTFKAGTTFTLYGIKAA